MFVSVYYRRQDKTASLKLFSSPLNRELVWDIQPVSRHGGGGGVMITLPSTRGRYDSAVSGETGIVASV